MMSPRQFRRVVAGPATVALLTLGLLAVAPQFSSPASAKGSSRSCATPVTGAPTGPATVATASTSFGRVLVVGSGANADCSLYVLTSDQLHSLTFGRAPYACSDGPNVLGHPCDTVLWPSLLTKGAPIAGPGVNRALLGTVTRTDVLSGESVQQVTYAGLPLYRFFLDETPGQTDGANLFDPVTSGEVVAQAGPPPSCAPGDAGLVAGGEGPPGADLADVGGHQQQRGEDGLGGDAADAAAGGLGEGFVGGVFGVAVEAFDGVAQGGVAGVPGR